MIPPAFYRLCLMGIVPGLCYFPRASLELVCEDGSECTCSANCWHPYFSLRYYSLYSVSWLCWQSPAGMPGVVSSFGRAALVKACPPLVRCTPPGFQAGPIRSTLRQAHYNGLLQTLDSGPMKESFSFLYTHPSFCPFCQSQAISRSRRRGLIDRLILAPLMVRPYRCRDCGMRYKSFSFRKKPPSSSPQQERP